jgi:PAS domain S-box-containing protein
MEHIVTAGLAMHGYSQPSFVVLSVLIAILSAYAALDLAGRVTSSRTISTRLAWLSCGSFAMGIGIWSMHYIGMLGYRMSMPVMYDWPTVLLSMLAAVLASALALWIVSRPTLGLLATIFGSIFMGGGIAAMHYIGMDAMRMPAISMYSRPWVIASIVAAVVIAFAALRLTFAHRHATEIFSWRKGLSALLMGLAIPVMHYLGMAAVSFMPAELPPNSLSHAVSISGLGTASIALVSIVMLCLVSLSAFIDRRFNLHAEAMQSNEERYRRIIGSAFDAFIGIAGDGTVTDWNVQAAKTFGWSAEEVIGKPVGKLLRFGTLEQPEETEFSQLVSAHDSHLNGRMEVTAVHKTGMSFPAEMAVSEIAVGDKKIYAAFVHDVTERKLAEQNMEEARLTAESANRAKSEFLANMSHEIRTPLNGVIGMTDLALETELTPEQRDYMSTVKFSADSLLTVINDILDFSKIEAGKVDLENAAFDLRECVETTLKTLALRADEKGLELLCDIAVDLPEVVLGDSGRLRQIVVNLIGNAIKFTATGEVSLRIAFADPSEGANQLHFVVSDTGIGISPTKLSTIFESFSQEDTSTTRQYGGTGLGLTISKRLTELMGGRIWCESTPGVGSQFHFVVPLPLAQVELEPLPAGGTATLLQGVKVLIVDDNKTNRRILEGLLRLWGMDANSTSEGEDALRLLSEANAHGNPYRLLLSDMHMPKMDGFMVVQQMKMDTGLSLPTVMMLSSGGHHGDAIRCQELGIAAYLLKPVRRQELQEAIARALGVLPSAKKDDGMITQTSLLAARSSDQFLNILLAEDNEINQKLAMRMLQKRGHRVVLAANGREAVESVARSHYDLVLMDVQMPEMDGIQATITIRAAEADSGSRVPIVAMTALVMKGDRERCLAADMDGYLSKPIRPQELDAVLDLYATKKKSAGVAAQLQATGEVMASINGIDLMERIDGDLEFVAELAETFEQDYPEKLRGIHEAFARGDANGLRQVSHGLKGALANLAATHGTEIAAQLESSGHNGDLSAVPLLVQQLEAELPRVLAALHQLCREHVQ